MRIFYSLYIILFTTILLIADHRKNRNLLSPFFFFGLLQLLYYVPNIFLKNYEHYTFLNDENTLKLAIIQTMFTLFVFIGVQSGKLKSIKPAKQVFKTSSILFVAYFLYGIGLASKIYVISKLGGLFYVLNNMTESYAAQSTGYGYLSFLSKFMLIGILLQFHVTTNSKKKKLNILILGSMSLLYMMSYFIYSSRGPAFELLILVFFCYHYLIKNMKIGVLFKPRFLLIIFAIAIISITLVNLRNSNNQYQFSFNSLMNDFVSKFIDEFSKVGRDTFTYAYFDSQNFWYGKIYTNIPLGLVPARFYPNKPPLDDGLYLLHLMNNILVGPTQGRLELTYSSGSIPFTSQGLLYANFGFIGTIFGGIATGIIYRKAYNIMASKKNVMTIGIYFYIMYMFGFTVLLFYNTVQYLIVFYLISLLLFKTKKPQISKELYLK